MLIFVIILLVLSLAVCGFLLFYLLKTLDMISDYEERVTSSVFIVEQSEKVISELLERPLLMDTPEIREILDHLKNTKRAVIGIATTLGITVEIEEEEKNAEKKTY